MPSLSLLLGVGAATLSVASATKYTVQDTYAGSSFFDNFNFITEEKTNGFVKYVDRSTAKSKGYISYEDGDAIFGVDYKSKLNSADGGDVGRESVRLEGKTEYNKGLFVLDIKHMPGGVCGTWPAFWSLGREPWPVKGEIDIIEGVNKNSANNFVLHTDTNCKTDAKGQTGVQNFKDCALDSSSGSTGCGVTDVGSNSYGTGFNANKGGYYVTEWQAEGIKIWFFPRGSEPKSLTSSQPDTSEFGTPNANFQGDCNIEKRFLDQRFIFSNTFCGDWAGNVYAQSGCPMYDGLSGMASCKKYVAENPEVFKEAYWRVSSFKTYNKRAITSSSSVAPSSTRVSSSSVQMSSSSTRISSSTHISSSTPSSSTPSSSAHVSSSTPSSSAHVSSSSAQASSSAVVHSSSAQSSSVVVSSATPTPDVSSSVSAHGPSSTPAASSTYSQDASSSVAIESSSTYGVSASETPNDHVSSSSIAYDSSSVPSPSASETPYDNASSSAVTASASETPYDHVSSSSVAHDSSAIPSPSASEISSDYPSSSIVTPSASETPYDHVSSSILTASETSSDYPSSSVVTPSASETPYDHTSSSSYSASASETPHSHDSSSVYPSDSSSYPVSTDVSSVYPSETPYDSSSIVQPSETPYESSIVYPTGTPSSSVYPDVTSYPSDGQSSSSTPLYSTSAPVYSVYPEGDGYEYGGASSKTPDASKTYDYQTASSKNPDASSKVPGNDNEYPATSSKGSEYEAYPTAATETPEYPVGSSSVPAYSEDYPVSSSAPASSYAISTPSVKSTPVYNDYPELPSFTPLYSTYPAVSSKPSYGDDKKSSDSYKATTAYQTTYVDVCPTGYTTITTKVTAIQTPAPYPTTNPYYAPPGFEVTTKYCAQGCGEGPKTVTVTVPCSKCQASTPVPNKPSSVPSSVPNKPTDNTPYTPAYPSKPSNPSDSTTKVTATKVVTLTKIPVPESQYYATHPSIASASAPASSIKNPDSAASKSNDNNKPSGYIGGSKPYPTSSAPGSKPLSPTGTLNSSKPVQPSGGKPIYPTALGYPGSNVTMSYGTATSSQSKPTQTAYKAPEFTGAASGLQVGGVVAGAVAVFAAMMM